MDTIELYPTNSGQTTFQPIITPKEEEEPEEEIKVPDKPKETYSQKWKEYDAAKTNEDILFKKILQELLFLSIEEPPVKNGRRPYSLKDRLFSMAIKIYYNSDLRKAESILKELKNLHYIEKVPSYRSIDNFFNSEQLSKILDDLILITAMPLAQLETTGAIDSTGFSTSRFDRWTNYKWGKHKGKERIWKKAHAVSCCKTNTFISVEVTNKNTADATMTEKVIGNKTKYFQLDKFVGDKAYSSRRILKFIHEMGMMPFIPFKKNVTGKSKGTIIWRQMWEHFKLNNEEYMNAYHVRSNIETSFHMVKKRFGDDVKTKTEIGNINEIKTKFLCHNICVLIIEAYESNIDIDFETCEKTINPVKKVG